MPNRDGTGPMGMGQGTGRRLGPCAQWIRGGQRGPWFQQIQGQKDEKESLEEEKKTVQDYLKNLDERLNALNK